MDFWAWVVNLPPESLTAQKIHGPYWSHEVRMLGSVVDLLRLSLWRGSGPRPKTGKWPWIKSDDRKSFGAAIDVDHIRDFLTLRNGRAPGR